MQTFLYPRPTDSTHFEGLIFEKFKAKIISKNLKDIFLAKYFLLILIYVQLFSASR